MKKKIQTKFVIIIFLTLLFFLAVFIWYLAEKKYLACATQNLSLCFRSKQYLSATGQFSFRYPEDYPLSFKTGAQLIDQYHYDDKYAEWVNFSSDFYPNAGGERLGSIIVEENTPYQNIKEFATEKLNDYSPSSVNIGGQDGVCTDIPQFFSLPSYTCFVIDRHHLYQISFDYNNYYHQLPIEYYQSARQLILATFTFN